MRISEPVICDAGMDMPLWLNDRINGFRLVDFSTNGGSSACEFPSSSSTRLSQRGHPVDFDSILQGVPIEVFEDDKVRLDYCILFPVIDMAISHCQKKGK